MPQDAMPTGILEAAESLKTNEPLVVDAEPVTTEEGAWAILVTVDGEPADARAGLERASGGFALEIRKAPKPETVARPAYPARGE